ncbi:hypothetical protein FBU31_001210 [Coemansia sp. 'formosensis']|nr:hypothetical protein FBU31_001210 [Coemansia sp. 'formosensis']
MRQKCLSIAGTLASIGGLSICVLAAGVSQCTSIAERKEIRDLAPEEWSILQSTVALLRRDGWFQWYSYIHDTSFNSIHGTSQFFPFHRRFVRDFEMTGQRYNPRFAVPYWNEFKDYRNPAQSPILSTSYFGGDGRRTDGCVSDGLQAGWIMSYPNNHCLTRIFNGGAKIQAWYTSEYTSSVMQHATSMAKFRQDIEYTVHGAAHIGLGGDMSTRTSTNDMVFMVHHAFIDHIWASWQGQGRQMTMDGPGAPGELDMTLASSITYYKEPVESVMQLGWGLMCYGYAAPVNSGPRSTARRRRRLITTFGDVAAGLARALPVHLLHKWFPGVNATALRPGVTRIAHGSKGLVKNGGDIPLPMDVPIEWVEMHGYDEVMRVVEEARDFVQEMNEAGYAPLY